ncbi:MAG: class I SAM-dependent methyltransferase [Anaerolineae bacterium]|nr:class I SAM-dependent methyltransferase [Anaerolineae bacterium]
MPKCKHYSFEAIAALEYQPGVAGKAATNHMKLYHLAASMHAPVLAEFGTAQGESTCLLLQACEANGGHLYSVDVDDCSDVAESAAWTFIQSDDLNQDYIFAQAPALAAGIDLLFIDSLHKAEHVHKLLMAWFPYVKANGYILFHDIDPTPYLPGQRKANFRAGLAYAEIGRVVKDFFYANEEHLFLEFHFGSTGIGIMKKLSPLGTVPRPAHPLLTPYQEFRQILYRVYLRLRHE